jgi:hypothetical protein
MAYEDIPGRASDAGPEPEREDREPIDDGQEDNPEAERLRGRLKNNLEDVAVVGGYRAFLHFVEELPDVQWNRISGVALSGGKRYFRAYGENWRGLRISAVVELHDAHAVGVDIPYLRASVRP